MEERAKAAEKHVTISAGKVKLRAILGLPPPEKGAPKGVVVFAHGSGSGRLSPRNNFVARELQAGHIATLLADLLEESESNDRRKVFNIDLLADRLLVCSNWLEGREETKGLKRAYFGASTGAGAALQAAAKEPGDIFSIVSRGGRPDLALDYLPQVQAPTLLIVGGEDQPVIPLNEAAFQQLHCTKELLIVPGASHLFEEPGTLEKVSELARAWFLRFFSDLNT